MKSHVYLSTWGIWFGYLQSLRRISTSGPLGGRWTRLRNAGWELPAATVSQHEHPRKEQHGTSTKWWGFGKGMDTFSQFLPSFLHLNVITVIFDLWGVLVPEAPNTWTIWQLWICLTFLIRGLWGNIFDWMNCLYYLTETLPDDLIIAGLWRLVKNTKSAHTDQFFTIFELGLGC